MTISNMCKTVLLAASLVLPKLAIAQAQPSDSTNKTKMEFAENNLDHHSVSHQALYNLNPEQKVALSKLMPLDDTTKNFYLSSKTSETAFSTPMESAFGGQSPNRADTRNTFILVRETVSGNVFATLPDGRPNAANKIIAMHVVEDVDESGEKPEVMQDQTTIYISTANGIDVVQMDGGGNTASLRRYADLPPKMHGDFLSAIADGSKDPEKNIEGLPQAVGIASVNLNGSTNSHEPLQIKGRTAVNLHSVVR